VPDHGPYTVIAISMGAEERTAEECAEALGEVLRHLPGHRFATARLATGGTAAVIATDSGAPGAVVPTLKELWPTLHACEDATLPYGGISTPAAGPQELNGALEQSRYALTAAARAGSADGTAKLTAVEDLMTLDALLAGIPVDVRTAFGIHALGPLADDTNPPTGCSWRPSAPSWRTTAPGRGRPRPCICTSTPCMTASGAWSCSPAATWPASTTNWT